MVSIGIEGKLLHLYEHKLKYMHWNLQFKVHQMGFFIMKISFGRLSFEKLGCNKAFTLSFIPTIWCLISQLVRKVKVVNNVNLYAKNTSSTFTIIYNNHEWMMLSSFNVQILTSVTFLPQDLHVYYAHIDMMFTIL